VLASLFLYGFSSEDKTRPNCRFLRGSRNCVGRETLTGSSESEFSAPAAQRLSATRSTASGWLCDIRLKMSPNSLSRCWPALFQLAGGGFNGSRDAKPQHSSARRRARARSSGRKARSLQLPSRQCNSAARTCRRTLL
jgi:hypothetical protein